MTATAHAGTAHAGTAHAGAVARSAPLLARLDDPALLRLVERGVLGTAAGAGVISLSLAAGPYQPAVAVTGAVGHLATASVLAGGAFAREVDPARRPGIIGLLAALTTLALLVTATHAGGPLL